MLIKSGQQMEINSRTCIKCKETKHIDQFYTNRHGTRTDCKQCFRQTQRDYRKRTGKSSHRQSLGIDQRTYEFGYKNRKGCCDICGKFFEVLCLDHDHKTKQIRGLICQMCNRGLGHFKDNIELLRNAVKYMESHGY